MTPACWRQKITNDDTNRSFPISSSSPSPPLTEPEQHHSETVRSRSEPAGSATVVLPASGRKRSNAVLGGHHWPGSGPSCRGSPASKLSSGPSGRRRSGRSGSGSGPSPSCRGSCRRACCRCANSTRLLLICDRFILSQAPITWFSSLTFQPLTNNTQKYIFLICFTPYFVS